MAAQNGGWGAFADGGDFGTRRTVVGREGTVIAGLEHGGFVDVPHTISINKSASYGFQWNQTRDAQGITLLLNYERFNVS